MPHRLAVAGSCLWAAGAIAAAPVDDWTYAVARGDTLIGISNRLLAEPRRWPALQRLNGIAEPRRLQAGRTLRVPLAWLRADATVARLHQVGGTVQWTSSAGRGGAATSGMVLSAGDTLSVGDEGSAVVMFDDGSSILLTPGSRLTLRQLLVLRGSGGAATAVELERGGAEARVRDEAPRPRFELRMPVLTLGVRGTEFRARYDPASSTARAEVLAGRVAAATGGEATPVAAGYGVVGRGDAVAVPQPLAPAPSLDAVPRRVDRLPLRLVWPGAAPAAGWRAQVFEATPAGRLLIEQTSAHAALSWPDLPDGPYRLRVRAIDADGIEGLHAEAGFAVKARPEPPLLREPTAGATVYGNAVHLQWTAPLAAQRYRLQVAADAAFEAPAHTLDSDATQARLALPPGHWWWRLQSVGSAADGDDAGPWSDAQPFELRDPPAAPPVQPPQLADDRLRLAWAGRASGDRYELQLARDVGFTDLVAEHRGDDTAVDLPLPDAGVYWVRVRTTDADGHSGPWGTPNRVEVPRRHPWWLLAPAVLLLLLL